MDTPLNRMGFMIALSLHLLTPAIFAESTSAGPNNETAALRAQNVQLTALVVDLLEDQHFDRLVLKDGKFYKDVTVKSVDPEKGKVTIWHSEGATTHRLDETLDEWICLLPLPEVSVKESAPTRKPTPGSPRKPAQEISDAILVIEGDQGVGTGFLVKTEGRTYLYTAAHVLSGNRKLEVKMRSGRKIASFGKFQASEGADLVRIEVTEEVDAGLELGSSAGQAEQNLAILAAGNSGGGGTVGFEEGLVQSVGAESIEIDAQVIQGNSGGPILDASTHQVLGLVTHLIAARKDKWAEETRFSDIRRFGCRLDRTWKWRDLPIGQFLKDGRSLTEVSDLNLIIAYAIQPKEWNNPALRQHEDHAVVKEVRALQSWIGEKSGTNTRVSESDQNKKFLSFLKRIQFTSRHQMKSFKPHDFVWFHREMAEQSVAMRNELIQACDETINNLR